MSSLHVRAADGNMHAFETFLPPGKATYLDQCGLPVILSLGDGPFSLQIVHFLLQFCHCDLGDLYRNQSKQSVSYPVDWVR